MFELCENGSLETLIDLLKQVSFEKGAGGGIDLARSKGLGEDLSRIYMSQLVNTLEYLQQHSVIHRDLKPMNIMLDYNCNLKLIDFGDAKRV